MTKTLVERVSKQRNTVVQMRSIAAWKLNAIKVNEKSRPTRMKMMIYETSVKFIDMRASGNK